MPIKSRGPVCAVRSGANNRAENRVENGCCISENVERMNRLADVGGARNIMLTRAEWRERRESFIDHVACDHTYSAQRKKEKRAIHISRVYHKYTDRLYIRVQVLCMLDPPQTAESLGLTNPSGTSADIQRIFPSAFRFASRICPEEAGNRLLLP